MILLAITSVSLAWLPLVTTQCFDQSGEIAPATPCNTGSLPTFCCPSGYACLSNGLCGKGPALQMGTCSDQSWPGGSCVKYCSAGYNNIAMCKPESMGDYCCEMTPGTTCCSGQNIFHLENFAQVSTIPFTTLATSTSGASKSAKSTTITSKTSSGLSSSTSSSTSLTPSRNSPVTVTNAQTGSSTGPPAGEVPTSSSGGLTTRAKIGTIVGGICGFAFVGFFIYFITFLLKRRHQDKINAERVRQIKAKVGRNVSYNNDGRRDREGFTSAATESDLHGTGSPTSRGDLASQSSGTEILSNHDLQYNERLAGVPQQIRSISPQTGYQHQTNADAYDASYVSRPIGGANSYGPVSPQESSRSVRQSSISVGHELGNLDLVAASQFHQLPSHYSFSGSASTGPTQIPARRMTPAQELAAARLRSNISPVGLKGIDD